MTRTQRIVRWLSGASTLLFTWYQFVPWGAVTTDQNLEDSWIQVQHLAFLQHLQFGRDIVFTFGPWGFLFYGGYYPGPYPGLYYPGYPGPYPGYYYPGYYPGWYYYHHDHHEHHEHHHH